MTAAGPGSLPVAGFLPDAGPADPVYGFTGPARCRCDNCKYGRAPGTDAVLYAGPDAVSLLCEAAVRDGRYEDIHAYADAAAARAHLGLNTAARKFARAIDPVWRRIPEASRRRALTGGPR